MSRSSEAKDVWLGENKCDTSTHSAHPTPPPPPPSDSDKKEKKKSFRLEFLQTDLRDGECQRPSCLMKFTRMDLKVSTVQVTQVSFPSDTAVLMTREV